jgi:predicted O-methyltransferase YrrM
MTENTYFYDPYLIIITDPEMNFKYALKHIHYLLFSRHSGGHGIHSPFVFMLISKVFRNKIDTAVVLTIENIRKKNLSNRETIEVTDLGSGSSRMKTKSRRVSDITRYSSVPRKYGILLANLAEEFGKPAIVEFGTSVGISTMYLAKGCPESIVYTMEGCPETACKAGGNFKEAGVANIKILNGAFDDLLPDITTTGLKPGLVFIDGNHSEKPLLRYFDQIAEISGPDTVIVIDDIHSSESMENAWKKIRNNEKVSTTVDIFRMGLVFFRQGMNHIDYIIRY